jgi:repressor LexA
MKLTAKQERFVKFIEQFWKENRYSPSVREIASGLGLASTSGVKTMLDRLAGKGVLTKGEGTARTISLPNQEEEGIPILGRIRAGMPVMAEENIEGYIPLHDFMRASSGGFFLIVEGESMRDKGIMHGDYVFIRPSREIANGQVGAFRINGEVTLKTFRRSEDRCELVPANPDFPVIPIKEGDDFEVIGRFVMLLRMAEKGYDRRFV